MKLASALPRSRAMARTALAAYPRCWADCGEYDESPAAQRAQRFNNRAFCTPMWRALPDARVCHVAGGVNGE